MEHKDYNLGIFTVRKFKRHLIFPLNSKSKILITIDFGLQNKHYKRLARLWLVDLLSIIDGVVSVLTFRTITTGFSRTIWNWTEGWK